MSNVSSAQRWMFIVIVMTTIGAALYCAADNPEDTFAKRFDLPQDPDVVLKRVLARSEFAEGPLDKWVRQLRERAAKAFTDIIRWIADRFPSIGPVKITGDVLGTIGTALLIGVAAVVVIAVGWWLGATLIRWARSRGAPVRPALGPQEAEGIDGLRLQALSEAQSGNFNLAVVYLFRYMLLRLNLEGLLAYHHGKTNRELLAALMADDGVRERVAEMVLVFNRVRYGRAMCNHTEYERFMGLCHQVIGSG